MLDKNLLLEDLFQAYLEARKHKRNTRNQLAFEFALEENIVKLRDDLFLNTYEIGKSIYFIQQEPVKREIFAGNFRDRIVHHLVFNYISPLFEKTFIYDSYSCRVGKGTSKGVERISKFIRSCSENYQKECWVLKLDIQGYFMAINKDLLYHKIEKTLLRYEVQRTGTILVPTDWLLSLIRQIIYNDPTKN
ncbi:MAG: hypothetical protein LBO09_06035 [Candidatus Peribacteria bacterium]|jgi:retron-type reverse transcriptase|nr:hypothetical protein [Candidatus Peribacteria bacterium]